MILLDKYLTRDKLRNLVSDNRHFFMSDNPTLRDETAGFAAELQGEIARAYCRLSPVVPMIGPTPVLVGSPK